MLNKRMPIYAYIFFMSALLLNQGCASQVSCSLDGWWKMAGRLTENYEAAAPYHSNRLFFDGDSVYQASGFFYNTLGLDDDYPNRHYPFVYYGSKEKYEVNGGFLRIYSKPYKSWTTYKINCLKDEKIQLFGVSDTLVLEKRVKPVVNNPCLIKMIKVHVHKGTLDIFNVGYKVSISSDDRMIYEQQDSVGESFSRQTFMLRRGTFDEICERFKYVDAKQIKERYPAYQSEFSIIETEIHLRDGGIIRSEIRDLFEKQVPEELRLALIPVLYLHQAFVYPRLPAKRFKDR